MKKSVIVLWIIAGVCLVVAVPLFSEDIASGISGVAIAAVLAFIGWRKYSKQAKATQAAASARASDQEHDRLYAEKNGVIETSVAGVTFDNDDGSSRQYALKMLKGKEKRDEYYEVKLVPYTFKNRPAIYVFADDRCVGNVKSEDTREVMSIIDRLNFVELDPYSFKNEKGKIIYAASLAIHYFK